jgi:hypothetical protein
MTRLKGNLKKDMGFGILEKVEYLRKGGIFKLVLARVVD